MMGGVGRLRKEETIFEEGIVEVDLFVSWEGGGGK
jgi:hypothetical protein